MMEKHETRDAGNEIVEGEKKRDEGDGRLSDEPVISKKKVASCPQGEYFSKKIDFVDVKMCNVQCGEATRSLFFPLVDGERRKSQFCKTIDLFST